MDVKIFQFNGCNKCFYETLLLKLEDNIKVEFISNPHEWKAESMDVAIITGYLLPNDLDSVQNIQNNAERIIAFGDCTTTGGIFALANQKGHQVTPLKNFVSNEITVDGCLGEIEELIAAINGEESRENRPLCNACKRRATCEYLDSVNRQIEIEDNKTCFNDLGFLCNGFIAKECKERCIDYNTPCRGCKPMVERSGVRMLGMFGTLMGNIEMATEHSEKGATDKLADAEDDVTDSLPDILGNFFRFTLPTSGLPRGRMQSSGDLLQDVFTGRLIEELPLIVGQLGGNKSISLILKIIETYEKANNIEISEQTKKYRSELLELEIELIEATNNKDAQKYKETTEKIRKIAGNMNLSNVYFGGFKQKIEDSEDFESYKSHIFEVVEGTYKNGSLNYSIDPKGVIKEITIKEG